MDQQPLFPLDPSTLSSFLAQYAALEDEEDRLREVKQALVKEFDTMLPMRAVRTAVKVLRARRKLAEHAKEPLSYAEQGAIEAQVQTTLLALEHEVTHMIPDMTGTRP